MEQPSSERLDAEQRTSGPEGEPEADRAAALRWIEALNARDLERILACIRPDVEFRPLRLSASRPTYRGREGISRWFYEVRERRHEIRPSEFERLVNGDLLVLGEIVLAGESRPTSFAGIYRIADGLVANAAHYLSDRETLVRIGAVRR